MLYGGLVIDVQAQEKALGIPVTVDNYIRRDRQGACWHDQIERRFRQACPPPRYASARPPGRSARNRDTLHSTAVFDLDAGPVTTTLPDAGKQFMSLMVIDEDHYVHGVFYGSGSRSLTTEQIGTRYLLAALRTLADPLNPDNLKDAAKVEPPGGPGTFELPNWDEASLKKVRDALIVLISTLPDLRRAFGSQADVDPVRHLIATASAWGGNPDNDAIYLNITPPKNDGTTLHTLTVKDVPVDAFWSINVYNSEGYLQKNEHDAYSLNSITAKKGADGRQGPIRRL